MLLIDKLGHYRMLLRTFFQKSFPLLWRSNGIIISDLLHRTYFLFLGSFRRLSLSPVFRNSLVNVSLTWAEQLVGTFDLDLMPQRSGKLSLWMWMHPLTFFFFYPEVQLFWYYLDLLERYANVCSFLSYNSFSCLFAIISKIYL